MLRGLFLKCKKKDGAFTIHARIAKYASAVIEEEYSILISITDRIQANLELPNTAVTYVSKFVKDDTFIRGYNLNSNTTSTLSLIL